ncbi:MAG: recombinase family protein [Anderseniella sp.]
MNSLRRRNLPSTIICGRPNAWNVLCNGYPFAPGNSLGYSRTSTIDQVHGLNIQIDELTEAGCTKIFSEQVSSTAARNKLDEAIEFVRDGDILVVTKLDRLARSVPHLWKIIETLQSKNVSIRILNLNMDTSTATEKLMLSLLGAVAEFEREMMLERQKEGIAKANPPSTSPNIHCIVSPIYLNRDSLMTTKITLQQLESFLWQRADTVSGV